MFEYRPLFTDLYQLTMSSAYLESSKAGAHAVFELFFRECPFKGEYAVTGGYDLLKAYIENFRFEDEDIRFLKDQPPFARSSPQFFEKLKTIDLQDIEIDGLTEGELVFPRVPILQVRGPLYKLQLLESAMLNAVNFGTLSATCARRIRQVAGDRQLVEFGLRRAQGPNGAMTASRSSYLGGFDGTSNVLAGKNFGIPIVGTMAHSFIQSYWDLPSQDLYWNGESIAAELDEIKKEDSAQTNEGELAAFLAYAKVFPDNALLLVDTYDSLQSGIPNAVRIFKLLKKRGYQPTGIRLDSGDLVYLSKQAREMLNQAGFREAKIFASNDLDEHLVQDLQHQGAKIDGYGIGTKLVTAEKQPALGGVYKLVEVDNKARIKLSQQTEKLVLPGKKQVYRLYGKDGKMLLDLISLSDETMPKPAEDCMALHPLDPFKRALVQPSSVRPLLQPLFRNGQWLAQDELQSLRMKSLEQMHKLRQDITRFHNPTPYKVSVSHRLKELLQALYDEESPPQYLS